MSTQEIPVQADFRERAKTNEVPIARLIGFQAKDIADGRATVVLAAGHVLILLFDKVITTIVRPTDRQQILGSVLVETKKAR